MEAATQRFRVSRSAREIRRILTTDTFRLESRCSNACAGNNLEDCGGSRTLSLYHNPGKAAPAVSLPSGWSAAGCITDNINNTRTLVGYSTAASNMTLSQCVNTCNSRGFTYAGASYAKECYCSNEPKVRATPTFFSRKHEN